MSRYHNQICEWCRQSVATHWAILSMYELPRDAQTINNDALFLCAACHAKHSASKAWEPPVGYGTVADLAAALRPTP
jgi:hypothetical protein